MIRCNQVPEQLVELPELMEEQKYSPDFLLAAKLAARRPPRSSQRPSQLNVCVLERKAISQWMTRCLCSPLTHSDKIKVGPYNQSASSILSRYSQTHGSYHLTKA